MVLEGKRCHEAKAADVDGDGDIDICFKPWRGSLHIYLRNMLVEDATHSEAVGSCRKSPASKQMALPRQHRRAPAHQDACGTWCQVMPRDVLVVHYLSSAGVPLFREVALANSIDDRIERLCAIRSPP